MLLTRVIEAQQNDQYCQNMKYDLSSGQGAEDWSLSTEGYLKYKGKIFVPDVDEIREEVLREFHHSRFAVHPGGTKMYKDLGRQYWWSGMKKSVAEFVSRCLTCQQVKAEHQRPAGLL